MGATSALVPLCALWMLAAPAEGGPPFTVAEDALPSQRLLDGLEDHGEVAVLVVPPADAAWRPLANALSRSLEKALAKKAAPSVVVARVVPRAVEQDDATLLRANADADLVHLVVARIYPGVAGTPPRVLFTTYTPEGEALASFVDANVLVPRARGATSSGMARVFRESDEDARKHDRSTPPRKRRERPSPEVLREFEKRALTLHVRREGSGAAAQEVFQIRRGGVVVSDEELEDLELDDADPAVEGGTRKARMPLGRAALVGGLVTPWVLAPMVALGVMGTLGFGMLASAALGRWDGATLAVNSALVVFLGLVAGGLAFLVGAALGCVQMGLGALGLGWGGVWTLAHPYERAVRRHNLQLARKLGLNPGDLAEGYFPG